jgi:hypothetical protein
MAYLVVAAPPILLPAMVIYRVPMAAAAISLNSTVSSVFLVNQMFLSSELRTNAT